MQQVLLLNIHSGVWVTEHMPTFELSLSFSVQTDTFASKVAAIQDQYADASIGNVTGSNAVNVFLGIGVSPARLKTYS